jgi:FdhD protein
MTLVAVMRGRDFEVFTHPGRILEQVSAHVA